LTRVGATNEHVAITMKEWMWCLVWLKPNCVYSYYDNEKTLLIDTRSLKRKVDCRCV